MILFDEVSNSKNSMSSLERIGSWERDKLWLARAWSFQSLVDPRPTRNGKLSA